MNRIIPASAPPLLWFLELISLIAVIVSFTLVNRAYSELPDRIPIHFGITGRPDSWGSKRWTWIVPVLSAIMWVFWLWMAGGAGSASHHTDWLGACPSIAAATHAKPHRTV